jgi:hypothetical protein
MTWDDVLSRLEKSGFDPSEEIYMENYGKILSAQRPEFGERNFRCTFGVVKCRDIALEIFLFPDEDQRNEFLEVLGSDPWWLVRNNAVIHFPECDPALVTNILDAIA